jgi:hypothetical protein
MFLCFADESGNENIYDRQSRFFIISGMLTEDKNLLMFEEDIANLAQKYSLRKKINLKSVERWRYDYNRFGKLSMRKRKQFWSDLYEIFYNCKIGLVASILDKWSFARKYKPKVRDSILERTYMHFLEKTDQVVGGKDDFEIIVFDDTEKKDTLRHKHYWWVNHDTPYQEINNSYWALFFMREEESHLLQMAHICAYNLDFLFNKQRSEYFNIIKEAYCKYTTKYGERLAIKIFPSIGTKCKIFESGNIKLFYWDYDDRDLRSEEEIRKMKDFTWPS